MIGRIILWVCIIWLVPLMYFLLRNETKFKKNIAVGVTLPYEGRTDPETVRLLNRYKRQLGLVCLLLLVLAVIGMLLPVSFGLSLTLFLVWTDLCIVLPYIPYVACNRELKQLKEARGWGRRSGAEVTADLQASVQPLRQLSALHFLLPLLLSLIPVAWEAVKANWIMALFLFVDTLCVVLMYAVYRWGYRRKAETVDENTDLTNALTRLRRGFWLRGWLWCSWFMGLLSLGVWWMIYAPMAGGVAVGVLTLALVVAVMSVEFRLRRAQEKLTRESGRTYYVDTDDKWIWGTFYYDKNDRHLMINARTGSNTTINLARPAGKIFLGLTAALLIFMPLMGVNIMAEERAPVILEVTETHLVASHGRTVYEIPLEEIRKVELLAEKPAGLARVAGTALETVLKGRFSGGGYGNIKLCMDPRTGPWVLVVGQGTDRWLLGGVEGTEEVYRLLTSETIPSNQ